jgi:ubiquinone/menaquinone biosynthesis C-methylase UbiE
MGESIWAQAVEWLRAQPDRRQLVRDCYYDDPILEAAQRYANSNEWRAARKLLPKQTGEALDLGAGRGICGYALAEDGWRVTAVEPEPGELVGRAAIMTIVESTQLPINVVDGVGEALPFEDATFDAVLTRSVLHHATDLQRVCSEICRVLKPDGKMIALREHVISNEEDLPLFQDQHPLHRICGDEMAYVLDHYLSAITLARLHMVHCIGPLASPVNYAPMTEEEWAHQCIRPLLPFLGYRLSRLLASPSHTVGRMLLARLAQELSNACNTPGRLYSFVAVKR